MSSDSARTGRWEQVLLALGLSLVTAILAYTDVLWRWDLVLYDAAQSRLASDVPDDIIVVAIDEASLDQLGRWPWPRRTHAQLVRRLHAEGAKVIALDILFAEPDRRDPSADIALVESVREARNVVLPVVVEQPRIGGQLIELLPLAALSEVAAALGHVHVELDADGLARGTYLKEGLGSAYWPAFALAIEQLSGESTVSALPGARSPHSQSSVPRVWVRDHHVLIPFVGGPGTILRMSYAQVLSGQYPRDTFKDRIVLIGVTATGLGDSLPTPVSGHAMPMPGVEINANLLHAIRSNTVIRTIAPLARVLVLALFAAIPVAFYVRLGPRYGLVAGFALFLGTVALATGLMAWARLWIAPAPLIATLLLSYPLWSWLRLETAMRFLRRELRGLQAREADTPRAGRPALKPAIEFLSCMLPIDGWVLLDSAGGVVDRDGATPGEPIEFPPPGELLVHQQSVWGTLAVGRALWRVGAKWRAATPPDADEQRLLRSILSGYAQVIDTVPVDSMEVVQAQIARLEAGQARLRALRRVVDDGLAQMADAVLLATSVGQIVVANRRAAEFLTGSSDDRLVGRSISELLQAVKPDGPERWPELFRRLLVKGERCALNARHEDGRDLLIQLAPLAAETPGIAGVILNASDISELKDSERRRAEMLSFLSHDLRSPLVSLLAVLELARRDENQAASFAAMDRVESYTRTTLELAEQFVELVRAESLEEVRREELDLVTVASNAIDQIWAQARAREVELASDFKVDEAWMYGDGNLLERAIVNLLNNAIKHNQVGVRVEVRISKIEDMWRLEVLDNGRGINASALQDVFKRFSRATPSGEPPPPGSGLGLAFVKVVTERHAGAVDVTSAPGEGTTFELRFPVAELQ